MNILLINLTLLLSLMTHSMDVDSLDFTVENETSDYILAHETVDAETQAVMDHINDLIKTGTLSGYFEETPKPESRKSSSGTLNRILYSMVSVEDLLKEENQRKSVILDNAVKRWNLHLGDNLFREFSYSDGQVHESMMSLGPGLYADYLDNDVIDKVLEDNSLGHVGDYYRFVFYGHKINVIVFEDKDQNLCIPFIQFSEVYGLKNKTVYPLDHVIKAVDKRIDNIKRMRLIFKMMPYLIAIFLLLMGRVIWKVFKRRKIKSTEE